MNADGQLSLLIKNVVGQEGWLGKGASVCSRKRYKTYLILIHKFENHPCKISGCVGQQTVKFVLISIAIVRKSGWGGNGVEAH